MFEIGLTSTSGGTVGVLMFTYPLLVFGNVRLVLNLNEFSVVRSFFEGDGIRTVVVSRARALSFSLARDTALDACYYRFDNEMAHEWYSGYWTSENMWASPTFHQFYLVIMAQYVLLLPSGASSDSHPNIPCELIKELIKVLFGQQLESLLRGFIQLRWS